MRQDQSGHKTYCPCDRKRTEQEVGVLSQFQRLQSVLAEPQPGAVQHGGKYVELEARLMAGRDRENGR